MVTPLPAMHIPTAAELAEITDGISQHDAGLVDAAKITINPIITAATFASETNIPRLALSGTQLTGASYLFTGQLIYNCSTTDSEYAVRIRHTTPVSGTLIGFFRLARVPYAGYGVQMSWSIPWTASSTTTGSWHFSVQRTVGTGTLTLEGGDATWTAMALLSRQGTIRTVST